MVLLLALIILTLLHIITLTMVHSSIIIIALTRVADIDTRLRRVLKDTLGLIFITFVLASLTDIDTRLRRVLSCLLYTSDAADD